MNRKNFGISFYAEVFVLIISFLAVILILTGTFSSALRTSRSAKALNDAVILASNTAESAGACNGDFEELSSLLSPDSTGAFTDDSLTLTYDDNLQLIGDTTGIGSYLVTAQAASESLSYGLMYHWSISVTSLSDGQVLYTLETSDYVSGEAVK